MSLMRTLLTALALVGTSLSVADAFAGTRMPRAMNSVRGTSSPSAMCASPAAEQEPSQAEANVDPEVERAELKQELLDLVAPLAYGFDSNEQQREDVLEIVEELEALNPTPAPLDTPETLQGMWRLVFTTSPSVRNVAGVMGINQWFRDARMQEFIHDIRCEPNYVRYIESVDFPGLVSKFAGNVAVAEGYWERQEDEPNTIVTDCNKVYLGPMKYDSDQWQSLRCLMIQEITYMDDTLRIQHGLVPNIVFIFEKLPADHKLPELPPSMNK